MFLEFEGVVSVECSNFFDTDLCATGFAQVLVFDTEVNDTEVGDAEVEVTVEFETIQKTWSYYPLWFLKPVHILLHLQLFCHCHKMTL